MYNIQCDQYKYNKPPLVNKTGKETRRKKLASPKQDWPTQLSKQIQERRFNNPQATKNLDLNPRDSKRRPSIAARLTMLLRNDEFF